MFTFSTALSALKANEESVEVVGNNLSNLNTAGFKASSLAFSDLVSQSRAGGATQIGMGVASPRTVREFTQGPIQSSGRSLDAAIQNAGFFISKDANGKDIYSRVGSFKLGADGTLITQAGDSVLGWSATNGVPDLSKTPAPILLSVGSLLDPTVTTKMSMDLNLNAQAEPGSTYPVPMEVVDSLGVTHVLTVNFTRDVANPQVWNYSATVPAADLSATGTVDLSGSLTFDSAGQLDTTTDTSATISISGLADGANDMQITWNFLDGNKASTITQMAAQSAVSGISQDGGEASELTDVAIADGGMVVATYSNGKQQVAGQLALANIRNPETLIAIGGNGYQATAETAQPAIGAANTGGRGQIIGQALEGSNVDIAREFTNLIVYQRGYQANAKVISAADELSQQTINLIR